MPRKQARRPAHNTSLSLNQGPRAREAPHRRSDHGIPCLVRHARMAALPGDGDLEAIRGSKRGAGLHAKERCWDSAGEPAGTAARHASRAGHSQKEGSPPACTTSASIIGLQRRLCRPGRRASPCQEGEGDSRASHAATAAGAHPHALAPHPGSDDARGRRRVDVHAKHGGRAIQCAFCDHHGGAALALLLQDQAGAV